MDIKKKGVDVVSWRSNNFMLHAEVRKVEDTDKSFSTKEGKTIEKHVITLYLDDDEEERIIMTDNNMGNLSKYHKGQTGTFKVQIAVEKGFGSIDQTRIQVVDFTED